MTQPVIELARALIACPSVTPDDAGCLELIGTRLAAIGFTLERLDRDGVSNLWARRGNEAPLFAFAGHTDVVPTGPVDQWQHPPFAAVLEGGMLHGRGAADMKGGLAAMVTACEAFVAEHPDHSGSIAFLLTSDEEGPAVAGTRHVVDLLRARDEIPDWCLIGEPSSATQLGDTARIGRRGSLSVNLVVEGVQGHVAYPQLADNPIHRLAPALAELCAEQWDDGNASFPPTTFQVSNLHAGTGASNIIPGQLELHGNFRYSTAVTTAELQRRTGAILDRHGLDYRITWHHSGEPFLSTPGPLTAALRDAVSAQTGLDPELSTAGGTSDGRFIAPLGTEVIEFGPSNATIHQVDECVSVDDLVSLHAIYRQLLGQLLPA